MRISTLFRGCVAAAAVVCSLASQSHAATLGYTVFDTRPNGSVTVDPFSNMGPNSLKFETETGPGGITSNSKASVVFTSSPFAPLGALGDLNLLNVEFYHPSANTTTPANAGLAVRLWTNSTGTQALVWEGAYNSPNLADLRDQWVNADLSTELYWQRANSTNHDYAPNLQPLSAWSAGYTPAGTGATLSPSTPIYGVQVSFGSGIAGDFTGYLDKLVVGFGGANPVIHTASIPEPATLALAGASILGLVVARRRQIIA